MCMFGALHCFGLVIKILVEYYWNKWIVHSEHYIAYKSSSKEIFVAI